MRTPIIQALYEEVEKEGYANKLGMKLLQLEPGYALVEMTPRPDTRNLFGMIHGGAIFSLIDEAFQLSCNSHGTIALALSMNVTYHRPADPDGTLRAESKEIHRSRKIATYEIRVWDSEKTLISTCLATAYRKGEPLPFLENAHAT